MVRNATDDLDPKISKPVTEVYSLQFTKFEGDKMIKSKNYDVFIETIKKIVGTDDLGWQIFEKDASGKYVKVDG